MILRYLTAASALLGLAWTQDITPVSGQVGAENSTTPTAKEGDHTIHYVTVGKATNNFYPNSINARPGDIVSFQFYPLNHSVIKAAYGYPCIPYEDTGLTGDTFYSGWMPVAEIRPDPPTWNLTINDTQPLFYYCGAPGSCIDWGMVGVINANSSTSISTQIALARQADFQLLPGEPFPNEAQQASMASLAQTATTATLTVTATAASTSEPYNEYGNGGGDDGGDHYEHDNDSSGLSTGAIAGIAVGAGLGGIAAAALFFLWCRTRSLKKQLDNQQATSQHPHHSWFNGQSRHASSLPPYQNYDQSQPDTSKPAGVDGFGSERSQSPQLTPFQMQQQQFAPLHPDQRYTAHNATSELGGPQHPPVELATAGSPQDEPQMVYRDYR